MADDAPVAEPRPGRRVLIAGLAVIAVVAIAAVVLVPALSGYDRRAQVNRSVSAAIEVQNAINAHFARHGRLPGADEAAAFARGPTESSYIRSIAWDAAATRVVATVAQPEPGKQFALEARVEGAMLRWRCVPIDLSSKFMPPGCRTGEWLGPL